MNERTVIIDLRETINSFSNRLRDADIVANSWTIRKMTEHMLPVSFGQNPNVVARNVAESMLRETDNLLAYSLLIGHADNISNDLTYHNIATDLRFDEYRYCLDEFGTLAIWIKPKPTVSLAESLYEETREALLRSIDDGDFVPESMRRVYNI